MTPKSEDKIFQLGCLTVLVGLIALALSAYFIDSRFWIVFMTLILVWIIISNIRFTKRRNRDSETLNKIFDSMGMTKPKIKHGSSYGFPHFTLIFSSEQDLRNAKERGLIESFRIAIHNAYEHTGTNQRPFDSKLAVYATHE